MDWKEELDKKLRREIEERKRKVWAKIRAKREAGQKRLKRFRCRICNIPAQVPSIKVVKISPFQTMDTCNWNTPDDLHKCQSCHRWACREHYHKGFCQKCAEKLL
jgi:hypothetical protein